MDEIEIVRSLRTEPLPAPETVAQHRDTLRAAIGSDAQGDPVTDGAKRSLTAVDPPAAGLAVSDADRVVRRAGGLLDVDADQHITGHAGDVSEIGVDLGVADGAAGLVVNRLDADQQAADLAGPVVELSRRTNDVGGPKARIRPRRRAAAVAAAAVIVLGAGLVTARLVDGDSGGRSTVAGTPGGSPDGTSAESSAGSADPTITGGECGVELPFDMPVPEGYEGPIVGPGPDALTVPEPSQLVLHSTSTTGSVEVRWPADAHGAELATEATEVRDDLESSSADVIESEPEPGPTGRFTVGDTVTSGNLGAGACESLQLAVADDDPTVASEVAEQILAALLGPGGALGEPAEAAVVDSLSAESVPAAALCDAPAGTEVPPNRSAAISPVAFYPTPQEALVAFLPTQETWPQSGYVELTLPDGTVAYGQPGFGEADLDDGNYVIVAHVIQTTDGWAVDSWESSGC